MRPTKDLLFLIGLDHFVSLSAVPAQSPSGRARAHLFVDPRGLRQSGHAPLSYSPPACGLISSLGLPHLVSVLFSSSG